MTNMQFLLKFLLRLHKSEKIAFSDLSISYLLRDDGSPWLFFVGTHQIILSSDRTRGLFISPEKYYMVDADLIEEDKISLKEHKKLREIISRNLPESVVDYLSNSYVGY